LIALVGQRIYYVGRVPQDVTLPYVVLQTIDDIPEHSHQGFSSLSTARIQINSFDDSYLGCKAVDAAVFSAIDGVVGNWSGLYIGRCLKDSSGDFDNNNDPDISGVHTDYLIAYNP
jgi:hypothetical protein